MNHYFAYNFCIHTYCLEYQYEKPKITNRNQFRNPKAQYKNECMANTDPWIYQGWDYVPRSSRHPFLIGHTRREPIV